MKNPGQLYIIAAPSGAGKTSLVRALLQKTTGITLSISHTTRSPRPGEVNGVDYHFVDKAAFQTLIQSGDFLEHAQVFGNHYGTAKSAVMQQLASGLDVLLEIDWQGARQVRRLLPNTLSIFILPPSREALLSRLQHRQQDSAEVIAQRMAAADQEMIHYAEFDFIVMNDEFEQALADLQAIIRSQRLRYTVQQASLQNSWVGKLTAS